MDVQDQVHTETGMKTALSAIIFVVNWLLFGDFYVDSYRFLHGTFFTVRNSMERSPSTTNFFSALIIVLSAPLLSMLIYYLADM